MGCGFKINDRDIIVQFLTNDFSEFSSIKDSDFCPWALESNVNNVSVLSSRIVNLKNSTKPNISSCRTYLGYKSNNKVNNYNFRHYKSNENYMIQYRNENKSQRCLPYNADVYDLSTVHGNSDVSYEVMPISNIITQKLCPDPPEKPLIHQVRFWQNQNPLIQPMADINQIGDGFRPNNSLQICTTLKPNNTNAFAQRASFNTKRNLDMLVPQGTTYDILSDDNRLNNKDDQDKLSSKVNEDGTGLVSVPYTYLRDSSKVKRFAKEGGSLEFAKLLDEKLRQLYEQKSLYQPIIEINRVKPEYKNTKPITRLKSASHIKEKSNQIVHSNSLSTLSVSGQSAGSRFMNFSQKLPSCSESQCVCCTPCLLPQMPAFGMHNFPKFIVYHKCTNGKCQANEHDE